MDDPVRSLPPYFTKVTSFSWFSQFSDTLRHATMKQRQNRKLTLNVFNYLHGKKKKKKEKSKK